VPDALPLPLPLPLCMNLGGATRTATIVRVDNFPDVAVPLEAWLESALALPLIEIALDVTIRTPVSVNSPACAVVRGLIGQRLRDLRCLHRDGEAPPVAMLPNAAQLPRWIEWAVGFKAEPRSARKTLYWTRRPKRSSALATFARRRSSGMS
jgi:hypothetical protein